MAASNPPVLLQALLLCCAVLHCAIILLNILLSPALQCLLLSVGNLGMIQSGASASKSLTRAMLDRAAVLYEGSTGERSASKITHNCWQDSAVLY